MCGLGGGGQNLRNGCFNLHIVAVHGAKCCAQHTGMHIVVVEALLIAIYLTEKKDVYIPIQPTSLPEATSFSWGLPGVKVSTQFSKIYFSQMYFLMAMNSHTCLSGASHADMHLS